jgi:hypothetical protein
MKSKRVKICLSYLKNVSQQGSKFLIEIDAKLTSGCLHWNL